MAGKSIKDAGVILLELKQEIALKALSKFKTLVIKILRLLKGINISMKSFLQHSLYQMIRNKFKLKLEFL